jgi:uncharacterized membrane protein YhdT
VNVRPVALLAALLPFLAVHLAYLAAAAAGDVPWCLPYIDSCTSISATGREPPASFLFRALMLPSAVIMMAYWWFNHAWLAALGRQHGRYRAAGNHAMLALGLLACTGLVLYVAVLGEAGDVWRAQRRAGTVLFFSFTFLAQLLLVAQLRHLAPQLPGVPRWLPAAMLLVCVILLALGVLTVVLDVWDGAWYDTIEDAFEWVLALLLQGNFLLGYLLWRRAGWGLVVAAGPGQ